jgi:undecaprenyl-diphosphatase
MKRWQIALIIFVGLLFTGRMLTKNNFHEVIGNEIYRSAQLSAGTLESVVEKYDIKTVISLRRPRPDESWYTDEKELTRSFGVAHHDIAMDLTFSPRIDHLMELRNLLENAPKPLLVHCRAGADRTGLAAIMAKLLDGTSTLEEARAQVSWKFHVVREDSMGIPFFDAYAAWLAASGTEHSTDRFNYWLENEYVDLSGNIHFLVDQIRDQLWQRPWGLIDEGFSFDVKRSDSDQLDLSGWAFDTRNQTLLEGVEISLGGVTFDSTWYGIYQPWLLKDFPNEIYLDSGWMASHPVSDFENGCHDLELKFNRLDGSSWTSPPAGRICIQ